MKGFNKSFQTDILDELDDLPCVQRSTRSFVQPRPQSRAALTRNTSVNDRKNKAGDLHNSIDELLGSFDLGSDDFPKPHMHRSSCNSGSPMATANSPKPSPPVPLRQSTGGLGQPKPKCTGIFLGGTSQQRGRNGSAIGQLMCCDALRCTKCDLGVIMFRDRAWTSEVDYLFFRNNYPTENKLASGQAKQPGCCAYSCQCSWKSVQGKDAVRVDSYAGDLNWVCKGHALPQGPLS